MKLQLLPRLIVLTMLTFLPVVVGTGLHAQEPASDSVPTTAAAAANVVLVTLDGLRWQELFSGADPMLIDREVGKVRDVAALRERFWRDSAVERRESLMPFFWSEVAQHGVVFGNPDAESHAVVTNTMHFSYPGYNEILCGFADPAIDSNAKTNNPNVTVLEWLNQQASFQGKVAAFCSWDVFPYIINRNRSGVLVNAGWESLASIFPLDQNGPPELTAARDRLEQLDQIAAQMPHVWDGVRYDYFTFRAAAEYVHIHKPRVLYVSLGETDDWAHEGRYDLYLDSARRNDDYIRQLWTQLQAMPQYHNNTTLILTTDHGRGDGRDSWKNHSSNIPGCERIWMAVLGPNVNSDAKIPELVTQAQIAASVAAAVGEDFLSDHPRASPALSVFPPIAK